jgi:hypothetical protein
MGGEVCGKDHEGQGAQCEIYDTDYNNNNNKDKGKRSESLVLVF